MEIVKTIRATRHVGPDRHQRWRRLYRVAYCWTQDPQLAADLVRESLTGAGHDTRNLRNMDTPDGPLFRTLAKTWRQIRARHGTAVKHSTASIPAAESSEQDPATQALVKRVRAALAELSCQQREIITLVDLERMNYRDIAEVLDLGIETVRERLFSARRQLERSLRDLASADDHSVSSVWRVK
ncbi:RNA polymerase sigma factor [Thiogranum longum]